MINLYTFIHLLHARSVRHIYGAAILLQHWPYQHLSVTSLYHLFKAVGSLMEVLSRESYCRY